MSSSRDRPAIRSTATDLELLRTFEPIVRFTSGEQFFPMDVERYVGACSLWLYRPDGHDERIVSHGELTIDTLTESRAAPFESVFYLRLVEPMSIEESARALAGLQRLKRRQRDAFRTGLGRLARGGLLPRLADALFSASLLLRGRVPQATAAAAVLEFAAMQEREEKFVYHGRVVRQSGWTICQYWLFFAYNNWRSGFHGVNDHESDWELVNVYLSEQDGRLVPEWVAYASHDFHGADLRRRWDDGSDLTLEGTHPTVFAGAGSHAAYFRAGEYQAQVPLPIPARVREVAEMIARFWRRTLGQAAHRDDPFRVPFIDFARGDGLSIGPGKEKQWTPNMIAPSTTWVGGYRGLWGLYAQDPIAGENAPAVGADATSSTSTFSTAVPPVSKWTSTAAHAPNRSGRGGRTAVSSSTGYGTTSRLNGNVRSSFGGFEDWSGGFRDTVSTRATSVTATAVTEKGASVDVSLRSVDLDACATDVPRRFEGTWRLVRIGRRWTATTVSMSKVAGREPAQHVSQCADCSDSVGGDLSCSVPESNTEDASDYAVPDYSDAPSDYGAVPNYAPAPSSGRPTTENFGSGEGSVGDVLRRDAERLDRTARRLLAPWRRRVNAPALLIGHYRAPSARRWPNGCTMAILRTQGVGRSSNPGRGAGHSRLQATGERRDAVTPAGPLR